MNEEEQILNIIAKLMQEDQAYFTTSCRNEYFKLKNLLTEKLADCLDEGYYEDNASIMAKVNDICEEIEFFEGANELLDKSVVNVLCSPEELGMLFDEDTVLPREFIENEYIPTFIVRNEGEADGEVYAISNKNRRIVLTAEECKLIFTVAKRKELDVSSLIKAFVVKTDAISENLCICIWPDRISDNMEYKSYLFHRSAGNFVFASGKQKTENRIRTLKEDGKLYVIYKPEEKEIQSSLNEHQRQCVKAFLSSNKIKQMFKNGDFLILKPSIANEIPNILLDVECFYRKNISDLKASERMLHEDLVYLDQSSVKEKVKSYSKQVEKKRKSFEQALESYELIYHQIINQSDIFQNRRQEEYKLDSNVIHSWDDTIVDIFWKLVRIEEYERAHECIEKMEKVSYPYQSYFEAYLRYCENGELDISSKEIFRNCDTDSLSLCKIKIALFDVLGLADWELAELAELLDTPVTGPEKYACAIKKVSVGEYREAAELYKAAWYDKVAQAGEKLCKLVEDYPGCDVKLFELADMMIPEANYYEGVSKLDDDENEMAFIRLKIAAALENIDAIEAIASMLFGIYEDLPWEEVQEKENEDNIVNTIRLYEYLYDNQPDESYRERIGLLYCKLGDFKRAINILRDIHTPEAYYECAQMYEHGYGIAMDQEKAMEYYGKCGDYQDANQQYSRLLNQIQNGKHNNPNREYREQREVVSEESGYCFITTAACMALHESKDCSQLNVLRRFRDEHISDGGMGDKLIAEYYRIGPAIVRKIDCEWNPRAIYARLWQSYILPSYDEINRQNWEKAKNIYIAMVKSLCEKYKIAVDEDIMETYNINI